MSKDILQKFKDNFNIEGYFPPCVFISSMNNQKYAICDGVYHEIPNEMTIIDVQQKWIKKEFKDDEIKFSQIVKPKRGKAEYNVFFDKRWNCTCSGFNFKGKCSHIDEVKRELQSKFDQ